MDAQTSFPFRFPAVLDATTLAEWKLCNLRGARRFFQNLAPTEATVSPDLHAGKCFATGLEVTRKQHYFYGLSPCAALELGLEAIAEAWGDYEPPEKSPKTRSAVLEALDFYFKTYPLQHDHVQPFAPDSMEWTAVIELPYKHPETGDPILYAARFDMLGTVGGGICPVDEKTTSRLGPTWGQQWHTRSQFLGYMYVAQQRLPEHKVYGTIVRGVAFYKREPKFQAVEELVPYNANLCERWYSTLLTTVGQMLGSYQVGHYKADLDAGCNAYMRRCPYSILCETQSDRWLQDFTVAEPWNPLEVT